MKNRKRMKSFFVAAVLIFSIGAAQIFPMAVQAAEAVQATEEAQTESQNAEAAATQSGFTVTGPITGGDHGWAFGSYFGDISKLGYVEEEYFLEGEAQHYQPAEGTKLTEDGMWTLEATDTAPYKTRFIVRRPKDPDKFNGIVIVEWANVSGGYDLSLVSTPGIYEEGFAYISVMTQRNGVYGFEENPQGLVYWDEARYGSLSIPDDGLSYDIFTQAARAIGPNRPKTGIDPMGGLEVKMLFAMGESQSGGRLLSYANGIQPMENTFDAIITLVNSGRGNDFLPEEAHGVKNGKTVVRNISSRVREDINCKVFILNSQSESLLMGKLVQPDTENIRSWQMAGVSHFSPAFMADEVNRLGRDGVTDTLSGNSAYDTNVGDWVYIFESVLVQLKNWIENGTAPLSIDAMKVKNMLLGYKEDEYGNALGGVRLPELKVPTAQYFANTLITGLIGYKIPFTEAELKELYPTHQDYIDKVTAAATAAKEAGIILPYRAEEYIREAEAAPIPSADVPEISN